MVKDSIKLEDIQGLWIGITPDTVTKYYLDIKKNQSAFKATFSHGLIHLLSEKIEEDLDSKLNYIENLNYLLSIGKRKLSINFESSKNTVVMSKNVIKELFITIDNNEIEFYKN
ncbi:hypothetical protein [Tenacibaculum agarivorans]|uniref:hypothetical protein n=1 Tax=Tenacibaculum agarivorans TaxID=1908389 RepID=UPI00094B94D5|nr:hypothetical protein [Tenacibaculum agarivorans]